MMNLGTYTYEPDGGILRLDLLDDRFGAIISLVSFESDDVIRIEENQIKTAFEYARQPLPELPPGARARLGNLVLGRAYTLGGVEKLEPGWQENYGDYRIVAVTDIEMVVGETLEEWLVSLRIEGEAEDGLYVLSKGQGSWGIWQLVR
jgi:hypothetical protein